MSLHSIKCWCVCLSSDCSKPTGQSEVRSDKGHHLSLILYTERANYSQSDSFSNIFRPIRSFSRIFLTNDIASWLFFSQLDFFIDCLFFKQTVIRTKLLICLSVYATTKEAVHAQQMKTDQLRKQSTATADKSSKSMFRGMRFDHRWTKVTNGRKNCFLYLGLLSPQNGILSIRPWLTEIFSNFKETS